MPLPPHAADRRSALHGLYGELQALDSLEEPRGRVILPDLAVARPNTWVALPRSPRILAPPKKGYAEQVIEFVRRAVLDREHVPATCDTCSRRSWLGMPGRGAGGLALRVTGARQCRLPGYGRARPDGGGVEGA